MGREGGGGDGAPSPGEGGEIMTGMGIVTNTWSRPSGLGDAITKVTPTYRARIVNVPAATATWRASFYRWNDNRTRPQPGTQQQRDFGSVGAAKRWIARIVKD